jgi:hypothetical protein
VNLSISAEFKKVRYSVRIQLKRAVDTTITMSSVEMLYAICKVVYVLQYDFVLVSMKLFGYEIGESIWFSLTKKLL